MKDQDLFLNFINQNYVGLKNKYWKFCQENFYDWDEDVYSDTIIRCYDIIERNGLKDKSPYGIESYFFKAFVNNIRNEKNYSRIKKRDFNITSDNINDIYEAWYNKTQDSSKVKLVNDLFKDFAILYIMTRVEANFDAEHFYLYRLKSLVPDMTFKRLAETTKIKASRLKTIEVQRWVKDNIKKEDVRTAFFQIYGDLI
jgi:hypothetical protein